MESYAINPSKQCRSLRSILLPQRAARFIYLKGCFGLAELAYIRRLDCRLKNERRRIRIGDHQIKREAVQLRVPAEGVLCLLLRDEGNAR